MWRCIMCPWPAPVQPGSFFLAMPASLLLLQKPAGRTREAEEISAELASSRSEAARGHWQFEQRLRDSEAAEGTALDAARQLRRQLRRYVRVLGGGEVQERGH